MRIKLLFAIAAVAGAASIALSKDRIPPAPPPPLAQPHAQPQHHENAEKAMRDYYGGGNMQTRVVDSYDVDGVKIVDGVVNVGGVEAQATLTSTGDYITMGVPDSLNNLPPGAQETIQLFKAPPQAITREDIHAYWVTVKSGNRTFVVQFDAAGRVRDVKAPEQIREDANLPKAAGPAVQQISDLARKRFAEIQVEGVMQAIHDPGYYLVTFRSPHGQGWAIMNPNNDVTEWRYPENPQKVPEAVRRGIDRDLHGDRVLHISRGAAREYKVTLNSGGEQLSLLVKPDGAVDWISARELHARRAMGR